MNDSFFFVLKEGFVGLKRSRFAGFVAMITVAISLILIGVFLIITVNLGGVVETLRNRVELEVFLDDSLDEDAIQMIANEIKKIEGVKEIQFVSKEMALMEYRKLFKDKEDDYFQALGYNPLPASFKIKLREEFRTVDGAESVYDKLSVLDDIHPEDVVFRREFVLLLEKYIKTAIAVDFIVGIIVCLSALLLVSNNIRLIIFSRTKIIETMVLVGATKSFIRFPLYIQGIIQGVFGGLFSTLFLYGLLKVAALEIPGFFTVDLRLYFVLVSLGALLGFSGSYIAVRKYL